MSSLRLYSVFHLNILFSSVPESARPDVVERCYWPLLRLVEKTGAKIAIEATGYTLEEIHRIDPEWTATLRQLLSAGSVEFVGSGYAQVIGPLVPAEVTAHNLSIGNEVYERLLGVHPTTGYIDEQTYSAGLVGLYKEAGYAGLIMEWNNAARYQPDWKKEWRYQVVEAVGTGNATLPVLWNDYVAFHKFQRYAHAEIELDEYLAYVTAQEGTGIRLFPLYGNDVEIFNFRPGRYKTEAALNALHEWDRIEALYQQLGAEAQALPHELLHDATDRPRVSLETPEQPIVVKKQEKYNLSRWALTGRDSLSINTECFRIYEALSTNPHADPQLWKDLCYAWDSDFRTHITEERFAAYRVFLSDLAARAGVSKRTDAVSIPADAAPRELQIENNRFAIETKTISAVFNIRRGLVLESLVFSEVSDQSLVGTIPHGFFDQVQFNADFYTGNSVIDIPASHRSTDLEMATNVAAYDLPDGRILITGTVPLADGTVTKHIEIDPAVARVQLSYSFDVAIASPARFHTGLISFNPNAFSRDSLFYACHNGGREVEKFNLNNARSIECDPVSLLVSCSTILGNTTGRLCIGDAEKQVVIETDMASLAAIPFVAFTDLDHTYFLRSAFSLAEFDDTTALRAGAPLPHRTFSLSLSAMRTS